MSRELIKFFLALDCKQSLSEFCLLDLAERAASFEVYFLLLLEVVLKALRLWRFETTWFCPPLC